jgi:hypothetical protein
VEVFENHFHFFTIDRSSPLNLAFATFKVSKQHKDGSVSFVRALNERPVNALNGLTIFYAASAAAAPNRGGDDDYPMEVDGHRSDVDDNSSANNRTADNSAAAAPST